MNMMAPGSIAAALLASATAVAATRGMSAANIEQPGRSLQSIVSQDPAPITDFSSNAPRVSYSSWFDGCGQQACACGIPPELLVDRNGRTIPHVALNVQVRSWPPAHASFARASTRSPLGGGGARCAAKTRVLTSRL